MILLGPSIYPCRLGQFRSSSGQQVLHVVCDLTLQFFDGTRAVKYKKPVWLRHRQSIVCLDHALEKCATRFFHPILRFFLTETHLQALAGSRQIHANQVRPVRHDAPGNRSLKIVEPEWIGQLTPPALVSDRGVEEAITNHDAARCLHIANAGTDELGTSSGEKKHFGERIHIHLWIQEQAPDAFRNVCSARFANVENRPAFALQLFKQQFGLRALARPVYPFKADDHRRMAGVGRFLPTFLIHDKRVFKR